MKGYIIVPKEAIDEETLMGIALDAGAEDIKAEDESYDITTAPADYEKVKKALDSKSVKYSSAEITMVPKNYAKLAGKDAEAMLRLMDALDEDEDVQTVYANFDISKAEMDRIGSLPE
jgi:transcriptional/translational regulatory protein YebC/TACO1